MSGSIARRCMVSAHTQCGIRSLGDAYFRTLACGCEQHPALCTVAVCGHCTDGLRLIPCIACAVQAGQERAAQRPRRWCARLTACIGHVKELSEAATRLGGSAGETLLEECTAQARSCLCFPAVLLCARSRALPCYPTGHRWPLDTGSTWKESSCPAGCRGLVI